MNDRQRFYATMHYRPRDRAPICDFGFWPDTLRIWQEQGLPGYVEKSGTSQFFGMDYGIDEVTAATGVSVGLVPLFEEEVLEDRGDCEVVQQSDGVRVLRRKFMATIPKPLNHLLADRASWEAFYKGRLDADHPDRYPPDWDERVRTWTNADRDQVIVLPGGSLYGWLRNWMGLESLSLVVYDDPAWFEEMVTTVADCIIGTLTRVLETGGRFDACAMWEDMCFNNGSLLGVGHFKRFLVPHYRRISDLLRGYGVDVIWVDCDGKIDQLIPWWLDAGVNCIFPVEVGTWNADPLAYRIQYGRELLMMGGVDKRLLAGSQSDIRQEVYRLAPLVEEGGYIAFCDHRVPPDVPLENYVFYLETAREVWGKGLNLKPSLFKK